MISWNEQRDSILIKDKVEFEDLIGQHFQSGLFSSFRKQMSIYGFNRLRRNDNIYEYKHLLLNKDSNLDELGIKTMNKTKWKILKYQKIFNTRTNDIEDIKGQINNLKNILNKKEERTYKLIKDSLTISSKIKNSVMANDQQKREELFFFLCLVFMRQPKIMDSTKRILKRLGIFDKDFQPNTEKEFKAAIPRITEILNTNDFLKKRFCSFFMELICNPTQGESLSKSKSRSYESKNFSDLFANLESPSEVAKKVINDVGKHRDYIKFINSEESEESNKKKSQQSMPNPQKKTKD